MAVKNARNGVPGLKNHKLHRKKSYLSGQRLESYFNELDFLEKSISNTQEENITTTVKSDEINV